METYPVPVADLRDLLALLRNLEAHRAGKCPLCFGMYTRHTTGCALGCAVRVLEEALDGYKKELAKQGHGGVGSGDLSGVLCPVADSGTSNGGNPQPDSKPAQGSNYARKRGDAAGNHTSGSEHQRT